MSAKTHVAKTVLTIICWTKVTAHTEICFEKAAHLIRCSASELCRTDYCLKEAEALSESSPDLGCNLASGHCVVDSLIKVAREHDRLSVSYILRGIEDNLKAMAAADDTYSPKLEKVQQLISTSGLEITDEQSDYQELLRYLLVTMDNKWLG